MRAEKTVPYIALAEISLLLALMLRGCLSLLAVWGARLVSWRGEAAVLWGLLLCLPCLLLLPLGSARHIRRIAGFLPAHAEAAALLAAYGAGQPPRSGGPADQPPAAATATTAGTVAATMAVVVVMFTPFATTLTVAMAAAAVAAALATAAAVAAAADPASPAGASAVSGLWSTLAEQDAKRLRHALPLYVWMTGRRGRQSLHGFTLAAFLFWLLPLCPLSFAVAGLLAVFGLVRAVQGALPLLWR